MHFVLYHMYKFVLLLLITNAYFDYLLKMYVHLFSTLSVIQRYCTILLFVPEHSHGKDKDVDVSCQKDICLQSTNI